MPRIGYARVSSLDQDLDSQLARLQLEGCTIIRSEKVSGASREGRPELAIVLQFLRAGDELVVTRLDRLGRDTRDVLNLIHECEARDVEIAHDAFRDYGVLDDFSIVTQPEKFQLHAILHAVRHVLQNRSIFQGLT